MENEVLNRLNVVFTKDFIEENKDVSDLSVLYEKVVAVDSTIERSDFDEYVNLLAKGMNAEEGELEEDDLDAVSGGVSWTVVKGVCVLVTLCYKAGEAIGKAIKNSR